MSESRAGKSLGMFSLAMITAVSVDSIRNLPATALFGASLIFFFILGALLFLLPCALVSAELASNDEQQGGVYSWVQQAFGNRAGLFAIWLQWVENVIWYPTILAFVAGTIGYLLVPHLAEDKLFLISVILVAFWGSTLINLLGIKSSARFSTICAWFGLIIPMALIIGLGVVWVAEGHVMQIHFVAQKLIPDLHNSHIWVPLTGIILSFCGMEIATVHARDVNNPQKAYPRAMLLATVLIVFTLLSGALAIAIVLPEQKISLVAGIMQAFNAFFSVYHLQVLLPLVALMLVVGGMGSVSNWIIAPIRGLQIAFKDQNILPRFQTINRRNAPHTLLIVQACLVSVIAMVFLLIPTVNGSYWFLTALAAQLYMMMYIMMFAAAIRLRQKSKDKPSQGFRIPGGKWGIWVVACAGLIGASVTFIIGFIPPDEVHVGVRWHYEVLLCTGLLVMGIPPLLLSKKRMHPLN